MFSAERIKVSELKLDTESVWVPASAVSSS